MFLSLSLIDTKVFFKKRAKVRLLIGENDPMLKWSSKLIERWLKARKLTSLHFKFSIMFSVSLHRPTSELPVWNITQGTNSVAWVMVPGELWKPHNFLSRRHGMDSNPRLQIWECYWSSVAMEMLQQNLQHTWQLYGYGFTVEYEMCMRKDPAGLTQQQVKLRQLWWWSSLHSCQNSLPHNVYVRQQLGVQAQGYMKSLHPSLMFTQRQLCLSHVIWLLYQSHVDTRIKYDI